MQNIILLTIQSLNPLIPPWLLEWVLNYTMCFSNPNDQNIKFS